MNISMTLIFIFSFLLNFPSTMIAQQSKVRLSLKASVTQRNQEEDALRVTVTPVTAPHQEWLLFGFEDLAGTSAIAYLHWERLKVPFTIKLAGD